MADLIDYSREDEDKPFVYVVYDEDNLLVNVFNEYISALEYCVEELQEEGMKEGDIVVELADYGAYVWGERGIFTVMGEPLVLDAVEKRDRN